MPRLAYAETAQLFVGPKGGGQNHPCLCGSGKRIRGAACIEGAPGSPGQPPRPAMKQGVHKTSTFSSSSNPFSLTTLTQIRSHREQERRWVEQAETAYARFVAGWNPRGPKVRTGAAKEARR